MSKNDQIRTSDDQPHMHTHTAADKTAYTHTHVHDPADKKRQLNRLSRIVGHLQHVRLMIEDDADCAEVLVQIAAVRSALNGLGKQIINEHISHCIAHAVEEGDTTAIEEFKRAIEKYL